MLLGQSAPLFVRRGRSIRYRLSDVLEWLEDADVVNNTAKASMTNRGNTAPRIIREVGRAGEFGSPYCGLAVVMASNTKRRNVGLNSATRDYPKRDYPVIIGSSHGKEVPYAACQCN